MWENTAGELHSTPAGRVRRCVGEIDVTRFTRPKVIHPHTLGVTSVKVLHSGISVTISQMHVTETRPARTVKSTEFHPHQVVRIFSVT